MSRENAMDYKNTPEGRAVQNKYADLLPLSRPEPIRPRMVITNRAKIFSPFAALRGYEDEIASEGREHTKTQRIELSDEGIERIGTKLIRLHKGESITVRYFTDGYYEDLTGKVESADGIYKELKLSTGMKNAIGKELPTIIPFEEILEVTIN